MASTIQRSPAHRAPFLEIEGLTRIFGGVRAVDDVNLAVEADEMRCVIGPNGCGKTTLFNLITGYLAPSSGTIMFEGLSLGGMSLHHIARAGIVRKFQVPSIFPELTVAGNVEAACFAQNRSAQDVRNLLETVRLDQQSNQLAHTLSHGQKQWLELAMVLATRPKLILLDEPAAGMTRAEKTETVRLIHTIRRETKASALIIEHDMDFVEALACPVTVMMMGKLVASGTYAEMRENPAVREAYLGASHGR